MNSIVFIIVFLYAFSEQINAFYVILNVLYVLVILSGMSNIFNESLFYLSLTKITA